MGGYLTRQIAMGSALVLSGAVAAVAAPKLDDWATVHNERHGFTIAYPVSVFEQKGAPKTDQGRVLVSKDGKAKLLIGAFDNSENSSLKASRDYLMEGQWAGSDIDYAPIRQKWFVLSGTRNGEIFYERVSVTCGGKLINSWVMTYPAAERKVYDRVLEAIARTYLPGAGKAGSCG